MKIGRNAPCPCGSGKKYKKCCLAEADPPVDLLWHRIGKAHDDLIDRLMAFVQTALGDKVMAFAAAEFLLWPEDEAPRELIDAHLQLFMPWFLFNWEYDPDDADVALDIPANEPVAGIYLAGNADRLDEMQVHLAEAAMDKPFSFLEVTACQPGRAISFKDIFTGVETQVMEKTASQTVEPGDILLARVVTVDHVSILMGCGNITIRPSWKPGIIYLRQHMKQQSLSISDEIVAEYDAEIRDLYFEFYEAATEPPPMVNTDGDPMEIHILHYAIDDPDAAFDQLCTLAAAVETRESLKETATLDEEGRVVKAEIPWLRAGHKKAASLDNTVLGRLDIDGHRLDIEVNSAVRAEAIAKEVEQRLGRSARHVKTETRPMEEMWPPEEDAPENMPLLPDGVDPAEVSAIRDYMVSTLDTLWKEWIDEKIPALGDKTPRQAVKTADGRESVEALLLEARRGMVRDRVVELLENDPLERVRRRLGLDRPLRSLSGQGGKGYQKIMNMITAFGRRNNLEPVADLAARLCRRLEHGEDFSLDRGRPEIWAAAIIYVIAQHNYIFDSDNTDHMTPQVLCRDLGTKQSTVYQKALSIRHACDILFLDPDYTLPEILDTFSVYETDNGIVLPKSIVDEMMEKDPFSLKGADDYTPLQSPVAEDKGRDAPAKKKQNPKKDQPPDGPEQLNLFDED